MERVKIKDGTIWPNPKGKEFKNLEWRLRYSPESITPNDLLQVATTMDAYADLILHSAFSLKVVQNKIANIRKVIK